MEIEDLKLISKLIHAYGIKEVEKIVEINSEFLKYISDTASHSKYSENDNSQIFTNGVSSIFYLEPKMIDFDLLNTNTNAPIALPKTNIEMQEYVDKANNFFVNDISAANIIQFGSHAGLVWDFEYFGDSLLSHDKISIQDLKLIQLLLKERNTYASKKYPIVHVEGKNGYAYVLTNNRFKSMF